MLLSEVLKELIDLYSPEELKSKGIDYSIKQETARRFIVNLSYKDQHYTLQITPIFNPKRPSLNFGITNRDYNNINFVDLVNSPYSSRILAAIFGLIRYWVDKYKIKEFEYTAEGFTRNKLYNFYLKKHFSDFENSQEKHGEHNIEIWKRL